MTVAAGFVLGVHPHDWEERTAQGRSGAALLALRKRAPKAPLSKLYDRHEAKILQAAREKAS